MTQARGHLADIAQSPSWLDEVCCTLISCTHCHFHLENECGEAHFPSMLAASAAALSRGWMFAAHQVWCVRCAARVGAAHTASPVAQRHSHARCRRSICPPNHVGVQHKRGHAGGAPSRGGVVYVLAPVWRKRRALCSCGWRGHRRLVQAWAVTDAHLHAARRRVPARGPAGLAGRPWHTADQGQSDPGTFTSGPRRPTPSAHPFTHRKELCGNESQRSSPDRPNASTPGNGLCAVWRRLRLVMRRDPVASVTSPAAAVRLADETLALIAVAGGAAEVPATGLARYDCRDCSAGLPRRPPPFGAHVWTGLAVEPLAALMRSLADRRRPRHRMGTRNRRPS